MNAAIRVEALKLARSPVGVIGTLALGAGTLALLAGIVAAVAGDNPQLVAKLGGVSAGGWHGLLVEAAQIGAAGGMLGFGVVLSWMFGREFADGTVVGLFALPVTRPQLALAKLVVYLAWAIAVSMALAACLLVLGLAFGYGVPGGDTWQQLGRQVALTALTAVLAVPVAWIATITRSLMAAVGSAIALVVVAQVGGLSGAGAWMPLAAPALWAMSAGAAANALQLSLSVAVGAAFAAVTCVAWARLQLDR